MFVPGRAAGESGDSRYGSTPGSGEPVRGRAPRMVCLGQADVALDPLDAPGVFFDPGVRIANGPEHVVSEFLGDNTELVLELVLESSHVAPDLLDLLAEGRFERLEVGLRGELGILSHMG